MNSLKLYLLSTMLFITANGYCCSENGSTGIVPENDLYIPIHSKGINSGLSEEQFNAVIDKVVAVYQPIVTSAGGNLTVERKWNDGTVNAYASRSGSSWKVSMFGGLARHNTITEDGFALVVCHEIGHHVGGAPKKGGMWGGSVWASNEGQADYFATLKCLRKVFLNDDNDAVVRSMTIPEALKEKCETQHKNAEEVTICIRGGMAGLSVSNLFQALSNSTTPPRFTTPDPRVVTSTDHAHPAYQCRLDTYFQGAICQVDDTTDVSNSDEKIGVCHPLNGDSVGTRPLCWFKPAI